MYDYRAKLVRIIDADTVELDIDLGFHVHKRATIRLLGFDAPELGTPEGDTAKEYLRAQLTRSGQLTIRTVPDRRGDDRADGFRRYLGDLYVGSDSINAAMIAVYGPYEPRRAV